MFDGEINDVDNDVYIYDVYIMMIDQCARGQIRYASVQAYTDGTS